MQVIDLFADEHVPEVMRNLDEKGSENVPETNLYYRQTNSENGGSQTRSRSLTFGLQCGIS